MTRNYAQMIKERANKFTDKFSTRGLAQQFIPYFESGQRIEVEFSHGEIKRGTVGVTTGWQPTFVLLIVALAGRLEVTTRLLK